jgi:uncharacterized protein YceH (UPF0502 family)
MELTDVEVRVLGCLMEKRATTPDHYPLSTNALVNACNQKSSRDPVMDVSERDVVSAMMELRGYKLCRTVTSGRTDKHKHVLDEVWDLSPQQLAALAIPLLRGPQSPGEIKTRTERYVGFDSIEDVERTLGSLAEPIDGQRSTLVVNIGRGSGQSQDRWAHLLAGELDEEALAAAMSSSSAPRPTGSSRSGKVDELEAKVAQLETRLSRLEAELGFNPIPERQDLSTETMT